MFGHLVRKAGWPLVLGASLLALGGAPVVAQDDYPARPVQILVPLAPASTVDVIARKLADEFSKRLGQQFFVENRPGAGGVIGTAELSGSAPDGHAIGMISSNHVINPSIMKTVPFDTLKDITPISVIGSVPLVLVAHPDHPANSAKDLIAMAKEKPGALDYGSAGNGTAIHLAGVLLTSEAGIDLRHVPYKGTGPLTNDLVAGHVQLGFLSITAALPQLQAGTLKALAVSTTDRIASLPDVPTLAEEGLPGYDFDAWIAMVGPKDMPADLVDRLSAEIRAVLEDPAVAEYFAGQGVVIEGTDPATTAAFFEAELDKHSRLVATAGVPKE
ncbi:Bug family tripartite tricarboxylate transporter substrate binding protein [Paracoccus fontiphilus]|uniref:Bug family tripartite tricarboxylate transporter substrate binding protein n=1 Tax=Paracoccus fontiphilus TaxID=1815556 RepID=UPI001A95E4AD|nr:tripartite tricarboxylate transporter substrate binding protein [Paracoccus fontiphilus]